jgi:hypothetical protein
MGVQGLNFLPGQLPEVVTQHETAAVGWVRFDGGNPEDE